MRPGVRVGLYNAVPNALWSVLGFLPVSTFCYLHVSRLQLIAFVASSMLVYALPAAHLRRLHIGTKLEIYRKLGVPVIGRLVQNGALIHSLMRRRHPHLEPLLSRESMASLVRGTYPRERFHWALFLFFLWCTVDAATGLHLGWALLILLTNLLYNLYPIALQQYLRLRLERVLGAKLT